MSKHVTTDSFQSDVLSSAKPVLVDFWAEWCGPCRLVSPILDEISNEHGDNPEKLESRQCNGYWHQLAGLEVKNI